MVRGCGLGRVCRRGVWVVVLGAAAAADAGTLAGSFARVPQGSVVDLSAEGKRDWVHWGLSTATSLHRKAGVDPWIPPFRKLDPTNTWTYIYRLDDHYNGFSWVDGVSRRRATNTTTGVWAYNSTPLGSGFALSIPADAEVRELRLHVGAYGAGGRLTASLSDGSAGTYQDASLLNQLNGEGGVYTLTFAADSAGQTLEVAWELVTVRNLTANVTLLAAALSAPGANNPPVVDLTSPAPYEQQAEGGDWVLRAEAADLDGAIAAVRFYADAVLVGEALSPPYEVNWPSPPAGYHRLHAEAADEQGEVAQSPPVEVEVYGTGGVLMGQRDPAPAAVDLTAEGGMDWVHLGWSEETLVNRKAGANRIADPTFAGMPPAYRITDGATACSWSDGTPVNAVSDTLAGLAQSGNDGRVTVTLPADPTPRRLSVYAGLYGIQGRFTARLSDASAPAYIGSTLQSVYGSIPSRFTLEYAAASPDQHLILTYRIEEPYDFDYGYIEVQALTLTVDPSGMYELTVTVNEATWGAVSPGSGTYAAGTTVEVLATPATYFAFDRWEGAVSGTENPLSVLMDADVALVAWFAELVTTNHPTPHWWLASYGYTNDFENAVTLAGANDMALWESYQAGLDPTDPDSRLTLHGDLDAAGTAMILEWNAATGRVYTVYSGADPADELTPIPEAIDMHWDIRSFTNQLDAGDAVRVFGLGVRKP
jgi:hypothetical protein